MPSFSTTLEQAIHAALALANTRRHELATLEHLLLALIDEPEAARVMRESAGRLEAAARSLDAPELEIEARRQNVQADSIGSRGMGKAERKLFVTDNYMLYNQQSK